jgi:hypothetical protein
MTIGILAATIRQIPGVKECHRWTLGHVDRLYINWEDSEPQAQTYIDLRSVVLFGTGTWRQDFNGVGGRGLETIRALVEAYRAASVTA